MHFSIGGHPAFLCPLANKGKQSDYYLRFNTEKGSAIFTDRSGRTGDQ